MAVRCGRCGLDNPQWAKTCARCGSSLPEREPAAPVSDSETKDVRTEVTAPSEVTASSDVTAPPVPSASTTAELPTLVEGSSSAPASELTLPEPPMPPHGDRWPAIRRVLLTVGAIAAVAFAVGAIVYTRYIWLGAAWAFGLPAIAYGLMRATRARGMGQRVMSAGAAIVLLPMLVLSTVVVTGSCDNRLGPGADLSGCDFGGAELAGLDLAGADLSEATLTEADLRGADLGEARLSEADLRDADLSNATLDGAVLTGADLRGADLDEASLADADFARADLRGQDLSRRGLSGLTFDGANLSGASLSGTDLAGAGLADATLAGTNLVDAVLSGADLAGATLDGADLGSANLQEATLHGASLSEANLASAEAQGANLEGAVLAGANLANAVLVDADLGGARLEDTDLSGAGLNGANLEGVVVEDLTLDGASLIGATGLPDSQLAQGLGVSEAALAETLTKDEIRLESRDSILKALGGVCRGRGLGQAQRYGGGGFHPLVLVGNRGGGSPLSAKAAGLNWEPMAVRFGQLVACVAPEERITVELCTYVTSSGAPGRPTRRLRFTRAVRLVAARTSKTLFSQTYEGSQPGQCPFTKTTFGGTGGEDLIEGSHIGFDRFRPRLSGYVR